MPKTSHFHFLHILRVGEQVDRGILGVIVIVFSSKWIATDEMNPVDLSFHDDQLEAKFASQNDDHFRLHLAISALLVILLATIELLILPW